MDLHHVLVGVEVGEGSDGSEGPPPHVLRGRHKEGRGRSKQTHAEGAGMEEMGLFHSKECQICVPLKIRSEEPAAF